MTPKPRKRVNTKETHMKKLLTMAALAACLVPAFAAEVTSSNTVGYSKINLNNGYSCIAPAFFTAGQDTTEITAMEIVDGKDTDSISLLNSTGNVVSQYFWFNAFEGLPACWTSDSLGLQEVTDVSFDLMEGFLFYSSASAAKFKHWGEVLEDDVEGVTLSNGYTVLGNPYNKALSLDNLVPVNAKDTDSISLLNSTGNVVSQYFWFNAFEGLPACWTTDSLGLEPVENVSLNPDEAFLLYSSASAATLDVDAP